MNLGNETFSDTHKYYYRIEVYLCHILCTYTVLQIRWGNRDNFGIIINISTLEHIFFYSPLEPSHQEGSNEGSQHMLILRNKKIIFDLSLIPPLTKSYDIHNANINS